MADKTIQDLQGKFDVEVALEHYASDEDAIDKKPCTFKSFWVRGDDFTTMVNWPPQSPEDQELINTLIDPIPVEEAPKGEQINPATLIQNAKSLDELKDALTQILG